MLLLSLGFSAERERAFNSEMNNHQSERAKNEVGLQQTHPETEHDSSRLAIQQYQLGCHGA